MDPTAPKDPLAQGSNPAPKSAAPKDPVQPGQFVVAGEEDGMFKQPPPMTPAKPKSPPSFISAPNQTITDGSLNSNAAPALGDKTDASPLGWSSQTPASTPVDSPLPSGSLASLSTNAPPMASTSKSPSLSEPDSAWPGVSSPQTPGIETQPPLSTPASPSLADISSTPPNSPGLQMPTSPSIPQAPAPATESFQPSPEPFVPPAILDTPMEEPSKIQKFKKIAIIAGALVLIGAAAAAAWFFVISKKVQSEPAEPEVVEQQIEEPPQIPKKTSGGFSDLPPIPIESTQEATPASEPN